MNRPAFIFVFALFFLAISLPASAQPRGRIEELRDQTQVTLRGKLRIEQRGWRTCFFIETPTQYRVMFDPSEVKPRLLDLIEFALPGQTSTLRRNSGRNLTVTGKLQLEPSSPYYCNGAFISGDQVTLRNGTKLRKLSEPRLPRSIAQYNTRVTLAPGADWKFTTRTSTKKQLGTANLAGCSLNGAADVLNCSCIEGFQPVKRNASDPSLPSQDSQDNLLQFDLDQDARQPLTINVECFRTKTVSLK